MKFSQPANLDWKKSDGLIPAVVQDSRSARVLMLAYMNEDALTRTLASGEVHFFSRSRQCIWKKGETSGNTLRLVSVSEDCDGDTLLLQVLPAGPVCHTGSNTCFAADADSGLAFLAELERTISTRSDADPGASYVARLLGSGTPGVARKVGEEAVEVVLASLVEDDSAFIGESADLLFHLLLLLHARGHGLRDVISCLQARHRAPALVPEPG